MKTLNDLVNELNKIDSYYDSFSTCGSNEDWYMICYSGQTIIEFSIKDGTYSFCSIISFVRYEYLDLIVKYLANHTPNDWFTDTHKEEA